MLKSHIQAVFFLRSRAVNLKTVWKESLFSYIFPFVILFTLVPSIQMLGFLWFFLYISGKEY